MRIEIGERGQRAIEGHEVENLGRLFARPEQADSAAAGVARSTRVRGLGLAIAKRLCDLQGWRLAVRSPLEGGRGTAFTLSFDEMPAPSA